MAQKMAAITRTWDLAIALNLSMFMMSLEILTTKSIAWAYSLTTL